MEPKGIESRTLGPLRGWRHSSRRRTEPGGDLVLTRLPLETGTWSAPRADEASNLVPVVLMAGVTAWLVVLHRLADRILASPNGRP